MCPKSSGNDVIWKVDKYAHRVSTVVDTPVQIYVLAWAETLRRPKEKVY